METAESRDVNSFELKVTKWLTNKVHAHKTGRDAAAEVTANLTFRTVVGGYDYNLLS